MGACRRDPRATRRRAAILAALCAALLVHAPTALAQGDSNLFGVALDAEPAAGSVQEPGSCVTYELTVRNTGASPIPQQHTIQISTSAVPQGWSLDPAPPESMQLAAGARDAFTMGLCPGEDAAPDREVSVTVTATVTDQASGNPSDPATVRATLQEESLFGLDIADSFLWLILGALAILVAIILISRKRTTHGVTLVCTESAKEVHPGRGTSFPIRIRNEGSERDIVALHVSEPPAGWDTFLPLADLPLDAGEEQTVWLSVRSPAEATPGQHVTVRVTARSGGPGGEQAAIDTHTRVAGPETRTPSVATETTGGETEPLELEETEDDTAEETERSVLEDQAAERPVAVKRRKGKGA